MLAEKPASVELVLVRSDDGRLAGVVLGRRHTQIPGAAPLQRGLRAAQVGLALRPAGVAVPVLWILFAFFASGAASGYVVVGQMFPAEHMGRVSTAINTLTLGC